MSSLIRHMFSTIIKIIKRYYSWEFSLNSCIKLWHFASLLFISININCLLIKTVIWLFYIYDMNTNHALNIALLLCYITTCHLSISCYQNASKLNVIHKINPIFVTLWMGYVFFTMSDFLRRKWEECNKSLINLFVKWVMAITQNHKIFHFFLYSSKSSRSLFFNVTEHWNSESSIGLHLRDLSIIYYYQWSMKKVFCTVNLIPGCISKMFLFCVIFGKNQINYFFSI